MDIKWIVIIPLTFSIVLGITMAVLSMTGVVGYDRCEKYNSYLDKGAIVIEWSPSQHHHKANRCVNMP